MRVEVVSLIYKSTKYLDHIVNELKNTVCDYDYSYRIVANDPTENVLNYLQDSTINFSLYKDPKPEDYYLNRVYRAWNFAGETSKADLVVFVNSDMMFSKGWLNGLINVFIDTEGLTIPCSMLIESGKLPSASCLPCRDFGKSIDTLDKKRFLEESETIVGQLTNSTVRCIEGGLYMPCLLRQKHFDKNSDIYCVYPEGNVYNTGHGTRTGDFIMSGDKWYFQQLKQKFGLTHISVPYPVYHWQQGEMDDAEG